MVKTKGLAATAANWKASHGRVPAAYSAGVQAASGVIDAAKAGEDLYAAKVQEAIANKSRVKGLDKVTDADWKTAATGKGAARIGPGMAAAAEDYNKGMSKNLSVIEGVTIAARVADPMTNIDNRLKPIAQALYNSKRGK